MLAALAPAPAAAAADVHVAFVGALSGPAAAAGRDQRDGFLLALAQGGGRLGGFGIRFSELDDRADPGLAGRIAERLLAEKIGFVTGLTSSAAALALQRRLEGKPVLLLSSGAGPAELAGHDCAPNFFSTAPPEDAVHANAGAIARLRRYKSVRVIASPGQRAAVKVAFRTQFKGELAAMVAQTSDDAVRDIRRSPPDAVYLALAPESTLSFLRAYQNAGLYHRIPVIAAAVEPLLLQRLGADFSGLIVSVRWGPGLEKERSRQFVESFEHRYGRAPSSNAMQGYDAALALGEAFRAAGSVSVAAVATALAKSSFEGVAGRVGFAANGFAIADWHAWEVFNESSGAPYLVARERALHEYSGAHADRCRAR